MAASGLCTVVVLLLCLALTAASPRHRRASSLSLSTSSFGTSLYKRLASGNHDNIIYSPLSVYTALTMTLLGAGGDTERELMTTLAVQPGQNVHSDIHTLMTSMTTNDPTSNLTLRMANALYYDAAKIMISESYADNMNRYYGTGLQPFQRPNPEQAINTWVEEVTKRAITNFLKPGAITDNTVLALLNALFFETIKMCTASMFYTIVSRNTQASWISTFDPLHTRNASFTSVSGAVKQVPLMSQIGAFSVKNVPELNARVLELPYKGGDYSLFIILPNSKDGLAAMENKLTGQILESILTSMPNEDLFEVFVPKFNLRTNQRLNDPLKALGLHDMFDVLNANLSGMVRGGLGLYVEMVLQEAMIEVTETGTKAAAVTAVLIGVKSALVPPQMGEFRADHAFIFVLRDKVHGVNLFMGRVTDPPQGGQ